MVFFAKNVLLCAHRAATSTKHLVRFLTSAKKERGDRKTPQSLRSIEKLQSYSVLQVFFFNVLRASGENHFLPRPLFRDKTSQRDSSKRKSKTCLYSNKFSGDSLLGKMLPRQGAFRMAAPLSELYIAGSTFTVCIKLNKNKKIFQIYRTCKLTLPINHFTFVSDLQRNYKNVTLNLSLKEYKMSRQWGPSE